MPQPDERHADGSGWVSATHTHNWVVMDPLVDWLDAYGEENGFIPGSQQPRYDKRFDYVSLLMKQSKAFETAVVAWLSSSHQVKTVATNPAHARMPAKAEETVSAMRGGVPIIAQAVLWNPADRMDGIVDLLIRSDVLATLCPAAFAGEATGASAMGAPALDAATHHYRAIDLKFTTLNLLQDGEASDQRLAYKVQVWIYNEALGKTQGYTPPASYLLGRDLFRALARVSHADGQLPRLVSEAAAWIRRLAQEGASWRPLPLPTVPELRPNLKAREDLRWDAAERDIAESQHDLTMLPYVNPERRARAALRGITRWDDPALSAEVVGLPDSPDGRRINAVLAANRPPAKAALVPERILSNVGKWRTPGPFECFVAIQTVTDQMDDFSRLPERGGTEMVFMVNWGWLDRAGQWHTRQLVARDLSAQAESELSAAWKTELEQVAQSSGVRLADLRLYHWGSTRLLLPEMNWHDLLLELILEEPIAVRGSFSFGLAEMAGALQASGLIESELPRLPPGPLAATAGAWSSATEAKRLGIPLGEVDAIQIIAKYCQASCRSMMEIVSLLRRHASAALPEAA